MAGHAPRLAKWPHDDPPAPSCWPDHPTSTARLDTTPRCPSRFVRRSTPAIAWDEVGDGGAPTRAKKKETTKNQVPP